MDPLAHTLTGAALAGTRLRRATPLATAALLIGANLPDVDALAFFWGRDATLHARRGWTHGILALVVWPWLLAGALLAWDRWVRRRRRPERPPARGWPLLGLAALAVLSHTALDWLNTYGVRWRMPFDGRWFYGDAFFIIEPLLWLLLGGVVFLRGSRTLLARLGWTALAGLTSWLVVASGRDVPVALQGTWLLGVLVLIGLRYRFGALTGRRGEWAAAAALGLLVAAVGTTLLLDRDAVERVRLAAERRWPAAEVRDVFVGPLAGRLRERDVIVTFDDGYRTGRYDRGRGTVAFDPGGRYPAPDAAWLDRALARADLPGHRSWLRFPVVTPIGPAEAPSGWWAWDLRYARTPRPGFGAVRLPASGQ